MNASRFAIQSGIPEQFRMDAAHLFDSAFGEKLSVAIPQFARRIDLFANSFELKHALSAVSGKKLLGLVGYSSDSGSLTGAIDYAELISEFGELAGNRAALILGLYKQDTHINELTIDGIAVAPDSRGQGVGTSLLLELTKFARNKQYESIRLGVSDINTEALKLYQRHGFVETGVIEFEGLRESLGFGATITMVCDLRLF